MQMIFTWNQFRLGEYLQLLLSRHLLNKFVLSHYFLNKIIFNIPVDIPSNGPFRWNQTKWDERRASPLTLRLERALISLRRS